MPEPPPVTMTRFAREGWGKLPYSLEQSAASEIVHQLRKGRTTTGGAASQ